jgi:hypothetical protein
MSGHARSLAVGTAVAAVVVAANASQGAYFSQSWGWVALVFLVPLSLVLIVGCASLPGRLGLLFASAMGALGLWIALSALWSVSSAGSLREAERALAYVALALVVAFVLRRADASAVAGGVLLGTAAISAYALATRLFPDRFETYDDPELPYRLSAPIGYWNALGLLAAIGVVLGLGMAAHGRRPWQRLAAALSLPVLVVTLYFTFSRGGWIALGLGLAVAVALDPRRLRLLWTSLAVAPASVVAVALVSRQEALTHEDAPAAEAISQGHRLALSLVLLALLSAAAAAVAGVVSRRVPASRSVRRAVDATLALAAVAGTVAAVVVLGGPRQALSELRDRFDAPAGAYGPNLNARLFSLSGNGRSESIEVAWDAARERPWTGHGAGSFEYLWYERRPSDFVIRDAHSLYAETFAELGVVGLLLLGGVVVAPLVAAVRARRTPLVSAAGGGFAAWAAHAALDWDWEVVGVTAAALLAGGVALVAARRGSPRLLRPRVRVPLLWVSVVLSAGAVVSLVGNQALFAGVEELARDDPAAAVEHARRAQALLVWSFEPELVLGDAAAAAGDREGALRAYRDAVATDPRSWVAWLRLAQVARGRERLQAYARVRQLNPLETSLPGTPPTP